MIKRICGTTRLRRIFVVCKFGEVLGVGFLSAFIIVLLLIAHVVEAVRTKYIGAASRNKGRFDSFQYLKGPTSLSFISKSSQVEILAFYQ